MQVRANKKSSLLKKTLTVGSSTFVSRLLGFAREMLMIRYLGEPGLASDAFLTALRIPNSLRKIFAEGALSAAFIPTLVRVVREQGREAGSRLMTHMFIWVEGLLVLLCMLIAWKADVVIAFISPGFSAEQVAVAVPLLQILIFFIFFISSSALLAGALQAVHHFFIPAFGQVVANVVLVIGLLICLYYGLALTTFAWIIVLSGLVQFVLHVIAYGRHKFTFLLADIATRREVKEVFKKFVPCILSVSMIEINLFIDAQFASYLPAGSISLLSYASGFMRMPLSILVIAFSTTLLPYLSQISSYAPKRLSYYLFEATKLVWWVIMPLVLVMSFFAYDIFATLFAATFSPANIIQAQWLLIISLGGLFFFSINKIILNMFYALHETFLPSMVAVAGAVINTALNYVLMPHLQAYGLALATSIAAALQIVMLVVLLRVKFNFSFYYGPLVNFLGRSLLQLALVVALFYSLYVAIMHMLARLPVHYYQFFTLKIGLWLWVGPLCLLGAGVMYFTRKWFGIKLYFID